MKDGDRIEFYRSPCCNSNFILAKLPNGKIRLCCNECMVGYGEIQPDSNIDDFQIFQPIKEDQNHEKRNTV